MKTKLPTDVQTEPAQAGSVQRLVSPLFLYLKSSEIKPEDLEKLRSEGYVPIGIDSFESVRIVEPLPFLATNTLAHEAFKAISEYPHSGIHEAFGKKIAKALAG